MAQPIATTTGICFAFPDVLKTQVPSVGEVPMPYPNVAQLSDADPVADDVNAGGRPVVHEDSKIGVSTGGEPGTSGGVVEPGAHLGACAFETFSQTVKVNGKGVVRQGDTTKQNDGNAFGSVMTGLPTVLVGG
jgi:uncharacterized Zn-binding protein involved in type VI secretion